MAETLQRSFNGQIGREHGRLGVFGLLEFVFGLFQFLSGQRGTEHETGKRFAVENIDHGLVGLRPNLCWGREALNQIGGHAHVLTALAGVHVDGFRFAWQGRLVGHQHPLSLQEPPLVFVSQGLGGQGLALGKFGPGRGHHGQANGGCRLKCTAGGLQGFGEASPLRVVVKQRAAERQGTKLCRHLFQGIS